MEMKESTFRFKEENAKYIMREFKQVFADEDLHLKWIDNESVVDSEDIEEMFDELRFPLYLEEDGYYYIDYMSGEKPGEEEFYFDKIAEYVDDNVYIEFIDDDNELYRLLFKNGRCTTVYPTIIWE